MKKLIAVGLITLFATSTVLFASPDKDAVIAAEKNAWQNIKDKKWDDFKKVFSPDFKGVYASGINTVDKENADVKKLPLKSYTLSDVDVVMIDKDVALITYSAQIELAVEGKESSGKMNAASVWKKEGSDWRLFFHTDANVE